MRDPQQPSLGRIYGSILLTYAQRPWSFFWSACIIAAAPFASSSRAVNLLLRGAPPTPETLYDNLIISTLFLTVTCGYLAAFVTDQTSRLLVVPQGFLLPRLRGPAIVIAITFTLAPIILVLIYWPQPMLPAARAGFPLYAGAIATLIAAQFAWAQIWPTLSHLGLIPMLAGVVPWAALSLASVRHAFVQMLTGERPMLAAALYAIAAILFILLWIVLANRRQVNAFRLFPSAAEDARRTLPAGEIPRLHLTASPWRRFRLRVFLTAAGSRDACIGALGGLLLTLLAVTLQHFYGEGDPGMPLALSLIITVMGPVILASRTATLRPVLLVHDRLLPQSRRAFARDHGLAILANQLSFWTAAQLALVLTFAVLGPDNLRLYGRSLAILLPVSLAFQCFFFGLLAWYLSFRPSFVSGSAMFLIGFGMVPLNISFFDRPKPLASASFACAAAMLVVGVALACTALRRWSRSEIT